MFLAGFGNAGVWVAKKHRSMIGDALQSECEQALGSWHELLWASPEVSSSSQDSIQRSVSNGVVVTQCSDFAPMYPSSASLDYPVGNQQLDLSMSQGCRLDSEGGAIPMTGPVCNGFIFVPCGMWYHRNPCYCGEAGTYPYFAAYGLVSYDVNGIPFLSWPESANLRFWNDLCEPGVLERHLSGQTKANKHWPFLEAIDEAPTMTSLDEEPTGHCSGYETEQEQQPVSPAVGAPGGSC